MSRHRWLGLAFLSALPILNLAHVFQARTVSTAANEAVALRVVHPSRALALDTSSIEVVATAKRGCERFALTFDPSFLRAVEQVRLVPPVHAGYRVDASLGAGQKLDTLLEFRAKRAGALHGHVRASCAEDTEIAVDFSMFIFP